MPQQQPLCTLPEWITCFQICQKVTYLFALEGWSCSSSTTRQSSNAKSSGELSVFRAKQSSVNLVHRSKGRGLQPQSNHSAEQYWQGPWSLSPRSKVQGLSSVSQQLLSLLWRHWLGASLQASASNHSSVTLEQQLLGKQLQAQDIFNCYNRAQCFQICQKREWFMLQDDNGQF